MSAAGDPRPVILHADLDCFYAAVEVLDDPSLRGVPLVVGGSPTGRGVVCSASYEARAFGVRNAMPMAEALRRCPKAVRRPLRFERYHELSGRVMALLGEVTPELEPLSLDEASLDATGSVRLLGPGPVIAADLRARVRAETGLAISVGVATTRHVAKIACDLGKPDGLRVAPDEPAALAAWLAPLSVDRLPGVGPATAPRLRAEGWTTFGELAAAPVAELEARLGAAGPAWASMARGEAPRLIGGRPSRRSRSISHETTFEQDTADREALRRVVGQLADAVGARARAEGFSGRTVQLKVRWPDFTSITRSRTLPEPTCATETVFQTAWALLEAAVPRRASVRLVGVVLQQDDRPRQALLFEDPSSAPGAAPGTGEKLDRAIDRVRARLGDDVIRRARDLDHPPRGG